MNAQNLPNVARLSNSCNQSPKIAGLKRVVRVDWLAIAAGIVITAAPPSAAESPQDWVQGEMAALVDVYKSLHESPELSFAEEQTALKMAKYLDEMGIPATANVGGHGVVGVLKNGAGPTLLLRADMDGLPVAEETGLPYASKVRTTDGRGATVGVMHACGHDMHMTNLLGTLRYLDSHRDAWSGTIIVMFQPAEERGGGAQAMIDDGLLSRFSRPDFALALHVAADRPTGEIAYRPGYALANVDSVDITVRGRGGHGAYPHSTIDPIVIAAKLVLDLQTIVSREMNPIEPAVITVGAIHGGAKHNVISDECKLQLTVRSFTPEVRKHLIDAIERKAKAAAASAGAPAPEIAVSDGTPSLYNDPGLAEKVIAAVRRAVGDEHVRASDPAMGGEDFGRLHLAGVPVLMMFVGSVSQERLDQYKQQLGAAPSLHSPRFYPDIEPTIVTGVTALASAAIELLPPEGAEKSK